jgi:hypothetical protein
MDHTIKKPSSNPRRGGDQGGEDNARQACATLDTGEESADEDSIDANVYEFSEHFQCQRVSNKSQLSNLLIISTCQVYISP